MQVIRELKGRSYPLSMGNSAGFLSLASACAGLDCHLQVVDLDEDIDSWPPSRRTRFKVDGHSADARTT